MAQSPRRRCDASAPLARDWEAQARATFLRRLRRGGARGAGSTRRSADVRGLLELFELEKALYELRYEINNRPDWARIPLRGLLAGGRALGWRHERDDRR